MRPFLSATALWEADAELSNSEADTVHSISPITTGHRLTLLYSLSHNSSVDPIPTVLDTTEQEASLAETLSDWLKALSSHAATLEKAVILLSTRAPATFDDAHRRRRDQGRPRAPRCGCTWVRCLSRPGHDREDGTGKRLRVRGGSRRAERGPRGPQGQHGLWVRSLELWWAQKRSLGLRLRRGRRGRSFGRRGARRRVRVHLFDHRRVKHGQQVRAL